MEKYFQQGKPCPVILCVGQDPLLVLAEGILSSSAILSTITAAASEADPTISSKVKLPAYLFLPTPRLPSKVFFIRETLNPMDPLANGSVTMAPGWKTHR